MNVFWAHISMKSLSTGYKRIAATHHINLAGEGGEYETLTLNAPFYSRPITYTTSHIQSFPDHHEIVLGGFT